MAKNTTQNRCSAGRHHWVPLPSIGRSATQSQRCEVCGARGTWISATALWSEADY